MPPVFEDSVRKRLHRSSEDYTKSDPVMSEVALVPRGRLLLCQEALDGVEEFQEALTEPFPRVTSAFPLDDRRRLQSQPRGTSRGV